MQDPIKTVAMVTILFKYLGFVCINYIGGSVVQRLEPLRSSVRISARGLHVGKLVVTY